VSTSVDAGPAAAPAAIPLKIWLASLAAVLAVWMVIMAARYFALQAGDLNGALGIGADSGSWLSTAYSICEPIGAVLGAWLGIALSARRMLLGGVAVFIAGMCLPLAAPGYETLMMSRIVTGLAGGVIIPQSVVILLRSWAPARTPVAIALFLSGPTAGVQIGGIVGGWGVEHFGWSFILWASAPVGALALVTGWIGCSREPYSWRPLVHADMAGVVSLCAGLGLFTCAVSQGDRLRWFQGPPIPILFLASAACMAIFVLRNWNRIRHPVLWVKLYRRWNIALGAVAVLALLLAISLSGAVIPNVLAQVQGFRPEQSAPAFWAAAWPQAPAYALCVLVLLRGAVDTRLMVILGLATVAIGGLVDLQLTSQWQTHELYLGQMIQGIGLPLIGTPLIYLYAGDLRSPTETFPAVGLLNLSRVLGGIIATAWASTALRVDGQAKYGELLSNTAFYPAGQDGVVSALANRLARVTSDPGIAHAQAVQILAGAARREAAVLGATGALATLAGMLFASAALLVLMAEIGSGKAPRVAGARP
jgi:MFS transporter, DHA2 family, multidrug resistance protein